jgi:long-chain fatty acid transport protein
MKLPEHLSGRPIVSPHASLRSGKARGAAAGAAVASLLCADLARGEGFRDPTSSAFELGRAGGRIAQSDDASAVAANPANLSDLRAPEVDISPEVIFFSENYKLNSGAEVGSISPWKFLPDVFAALPVPKTPLTFGVGVTTPFGLSSEYPQNNAFTSQNAGVPFPYYSSLMVVNANPSVAWKINDRLKVGAGLDIFESQLDLRVSNIPIPPSATALARYFGEGTGFGGNFGVTWEPVDGHRFAATYRSPVGVDYSGNFNLPPVLPAASSFNSSITFPTIVSAGYGWQVTKTIRLETDAEWIQFSRFGSLPLTTGAAVLPQSVAENWKDTFTFGLAGDWSFAPGWVVRGGYQYYQSPVPASTFSPAIPDANQNAITAGLGYKGARQGIELGYAAILYNERDIAAGSGSNYPGKYQVMAHLISVTYRYSF